MPSEKARKVAEEVTRDLGGAGYYKDAGILAGFLQNRFGSSPDKAAQVAAAVLDDLRGAAYYNDAGVLADYLDGQFGEGSVVG
jgi:hypothetical protein